MNASTLASAPSAPPASRARVALVATPAEGEAADVTPGAYLAALALAEGLRGRHAMACALALFLVRAASEPRSPNGRRWGRTASLRRAIELVDSARDVLAAMLEAEDAP